MNDCLKKSGLDDYIGSLTLGIDTIVGENGIKISGGQVQRIGIARALYHDPEILVLDEATSSLDSQTEASIVDTLKEIKGKKRKEKERTKKGKKKDACEKTNERVGGTFGRGSGGVKGGGPAWGYLRKRVWATPGWNGG